MKKKHEEMSVQPSKNGDFRAPIATAVPRRRKKANVSRVRLTHLEVRRGSHLRLRIAVADDALAELGDELGALIKKIAPSTRTVIVEPPVPVPGPNDFLVSPTHADDDESYHETLRGHLTELFSSFCDRSLADALEIAREERARRAEGGN